MANEQQFNNRGSPEGLGHKGKQMTYLGAFAEPLADAESPDLPGLDPRLRSESLGLDPGSSF